MKTRNTSQQGFTLLEMVIVIGIVGSLLGAFFAFYQPLRDADSNAETRKRQDRVMNSLASYVLSNNRLPCPAKPEEPDEAKFGQENTDGDTSLTKCGYTFVPDAYPNAVARMGLVPFRELGLSARDAQDGYGNFMTYIMFNQAALPMYDPANPSERINADHNSKTYRDGAGIHFDKPKSYFCYNYQGDLGYRERSSVNTEWNPTAPALSVYVNNTTQSVDYSPVSTRSTRARFVVALISYGPHGYGGYNITAAIPADRLRPIGAAISPTFLDANLGTIERNNAVDKVFPLNFSGGAIVPRTDHSNIYEATYNTRPGTDHFDDQVMYSDGVNLIARLGTTGCHDYYKP